MQTKVMSNFVNILPSSNPARAETVNKEMFKVRREVSASAHLGFITIDEEMGPEPDYVPCSYWEDVTPKNASTPYFHTQAEAEAFRATLR